MPFLKHEAHSQLSFTMLASGTQMEVTTPAFQNGNKNALKTGHLPLKETHMQMVKGYSQKPFSNHFHLTGLELPECKIEYEHP